MQAYTYPRMRTGSIYSAFKIASIIVAAAPAGAAVACFAAEGDAAAVGGGPRSSVAWSYSGLRPEAFFEAAAPRATAKAGKPKRQSRQHEKATKSKVKYGSRR